MAVMGYSLCNQQLGLCSHVCPSISAALGNRGILPLSLWGGQFDDVHNHDRLFWGLGIRQAGEDERAFEKDTGLHIQG